MVFLFLISWYLYLVNVTLVAIYSGFHEESQLMFVSPSGFPTGPDETLANAGQKQRH